MRNCARCGQRFTRSGSGPFCSVDCSFWAKVDKYGPVLRPELGACWVWTGSRNAQAYGHIGLNRRVEKAHRVAWYLAHGKLPERHCLHKCDNPSCVRIDHLFDGTPADNCRDKLSKGRGRAAPGEHNAGAKLKPSDVLSIRDERKQGATLAELAQKHAVSDTQVCSIVARKSWAHLPEAQQ